MNSFTRSAYEANTLNRMTKSDEKKKKTSVLIYLGRAHLKVNLSSTTSIAMKKRPSQFLPILMTVAK